MGALLKCYNLIWHKNWFLTADSLHILSGQSQY